MNSREGKDFDWHVNGLYVALGPGNEVYTDTAADTAWGCRASLISRTNMRWSALQELGYSIQGFVQPTSAVPTPTSKLVDAPDLPIVTEHMAATDEAPTAVNLIDRAVDALLRARAHNTTMQTKWVPGSPYWHANESIDDEIHNALAALGQ